MGQQGFRGEQKWFKGWHPLPPVAESQLNIISCETTVSKVINLVVSICNFN